MLCRKTTVLLFVALDQRNDLCWVVSVKVKRRLISMGHEVLANMVDLGVYTKDREMRLCGSSKFGKPHVLRPVKPDTPFADTTVTWLDSVTIQLVVPLFIPRSLRPKDSGSKRKHARVAEPGPEPVADNHLGRMRVLELVQAVGIFQQCGS